MSLEAISKPKRPTRRVIVQRERMICEWRAPWPQRVEAWVWRHRLLWALLGGLWSK